MKITKSIWRGGLLATSLLLGSVTGVASEPSASVLSIAERNYLDTYHFYHEIEVGISPGEFEDPIYEHFIVPVLYDISDFVIHGAWAPGEVDAWSFGWKDWTFSWNLSEPEGRRPYAADHNPWYDFTYYGFDLHVSSPSYSLVSGGLGGFPDRFGLVDEGTIFQDLSGFVYSWNYIPAIGEGPYFRSNLVQAVSFFDYLTPAGDELVGEGLLSFSAGFDDDGLWTRLVVGERLGIIPEPSTVTLLGLGALGWLGWRSRSRLTCSGRSSRS
jgi:hypothetical protein